MSRFLLPISRNWIGEEFYGTKYALSVAAPHAVSPFLYAKCVLFACGAAPDFPRAAAYCNGFLQALRSGAVDGDLVQYIEHFDRSALGKSPGLRRKDENELKVIRMMTPMQQRTMVYDAVKAAMYLRGGAAPNTIQMMIAYRQRLAEKVASSDIAYAMRESRIDEAEAERGESITDLIPPNEAPPLADQADSAVDAAVEKLRQLLHHPNNGNGNGHQNLDDDDSSSLAAASSPSAAAGQQAANGGAARSGGAAATSASSAHASSASASHSLTVLHEIFAENELVDLDVLGRELGLAPDVVIKACEIALQERELTRRKAVLFDV